MAEPRQYVLTGSEYVGNVQVKSGEEGIDHQLAEDYDWHHHQTGCELKLCSQLWTAERELKLARERLRDARHEIQGIQNANRGLRDSLQDAERALVAVDSEWVPPQPCPPQLVGVLQMVVNEYHRARAKHGDKCIDGPGYTDVARLAILVEEVGEVAHELTYDSQPEGAGDRLLKELVQVAAMAGTWASTLVPVNIISAGIVTADLIVSGGWGTTNPDPDDDCEFC